VSIDAERVREIRERYPFLNDAHEVGSRMATRDTLVRPYAG
jgi:hypothetical protein